MIQVDDIVYVHQRNSNEPEFAKVKSVSFNQFGLTEIQISWKVEHLDQFIEEKTKTFRCNEQNYLQYVSKCNIQIGDEVEVLNEQLTYLTYDLMAMEMNLTKYNKHYLAKKNKIYKVVDVLPHLSHSEYLLIGISDGNEEYIIKSNGVKKVEQKYYPDLSQHIGRYIKALVDGPHGSKKKVPTGAIGKIIDKRDADFPEYTKECGRYYYCPTALTEGSLGVRYELMPEGWKPEESVSSSKPKRTIDSIKKNEVVHCPTEEEAIEFCKLLHKEGKIWSSGISYLEKNLWNINEKNTCYEVRIGLIGSKNHFIKQNYIITNVSEFLTEPKYSNINTGKFKIGDTVKVSYFTPKQQYEEDVIEWLESVCWDDLSMDKFLEGYFKIVEIDNITNNNQGYLLKYDDTCPGYWFPECVLQKIGNSSLPVNESKESNQKQNGNKIESKRTKTIINVEKSSIPRGRQVTISSKQSKITIKRGHPFSGNRVEF